MQSPVKEETGIFFFPFFFFPFFLLFPLRPFISPHAAVNIEFPLPELSPPHVSRLFLFSFSPAPLLQFSSSTRRPLGLADELAYLSLDWRCVCYMIDA